ncbi:unnamed protein product [Lymnaea stagnalis]|uniref:Regulator of telomere elongation helicase 1 homolog n=1 Tax=Lymnaea stagnalis TaxID=6523 RepID=A0AAV2I1A9_LYMST
MPLLDINGVQIHFPFTPYQCQVDYMTKVLMCLQQNQNGILESPTGTGKTLSLLCASLAWQEARKAQVELNKQIGIASTLSSENVNINLGKLTQNLQTASGTSWGTEEFLVPRIIYASRTHSQLSQAAQELKRTAYNSVKSSVIGSREQLCIHQQVQKLTSNAAKVHMCRAKVTARQCHFYNNIEEFKKKGDARKLMGNVVDIEDIVKAGHKTKTCPYYMARELKSDSDIVFMPYNYLLDNKSRKAHGVELQGSIIIFDEAHNLEKICEESASFDLSSLDLATAIEETTKLGEKVAEMSATEAEFSQIEDSAISKIYLTVLFIVIEKNLLNLEKLDGLEIPSHAEGRTLPGSFIFEFLSEVNITWSTKNLLIDVLDKMTAFLGNDDGNSLLNTKGAGLSKFSDCLKIVFSQEPHESHSLSSHQSILSQHFKVHIQKKDSDKQFKKKIDTWSSNTNPDKNERILSYWCFSPGHTMKDLQTHGVKVIILTSGTLSPLDSFAKEMQIPFPIQLENPHVIEKSQVWLGTLCKGPDGTELNSEYKNRSNESYQKSLGNTIVNFARIVPSGLLIFFPSYPVMEKCIEKWKETNQWNIITQYKPVVVEPKGKAAFVEIMDEFYSKINDPTLNGAIFMAVCRGKVSEGLDFADANGRAVMITGLPFPPMFDPRVKLKMQFLMENKQNFKGLDGNTWYRQQATRAVNQAIGRVIRHNKDFGAIVLCDKRFDSAQSKNALPLWVRDQAQVYSNFGLAIRDVIRFFKEAEKNFPTPGSKPVKSSGKTDAGIISGACFEPSFTKSQGRQHLSIAYERASDVACHIPSLKSTVDDDDASIYRQYSHKKSGITLGKKRSLLEALETDEDKSNKPTSEDNTSPTQIPFFQPPMKKLPGKQKKIIIKAVLPEVIVSKSSTDITARVEQVKKQMINETHHNYVDQVKAALSKDCYKRFSYTLAKYLKEKDIHDLVAVFAEIFTSCPQNYHLFQKFIPFVKLADKQYYARTCFELTGLKCDYKPTPGGDKRPLGTNSDNKLNPPKELRCSKSEAESSSKDSCNTRTTTPVVDPESNSVLKCPGSSSQEIEGETIFSTCLFCNQKPFNGMRHECGATCCFLCWKTNTFEGPAERKCPYIHCGKRVQRKHLVTVTDTIDAAS